MNKSKIRSKILKIRKNNFNKNLKVNLDKFISFLKINTYNLKNLGGYYPSNYEIDDLEILDLLEKKNFKISLPIIQKNNQMNFFKWSNNDPLRINKFGIPEPVSSKIHYPDILLVPLVGYDNNFVVLGLKKIAYIKNMLIKNKMFYLINIAIMNIYDPISIKEKSFIH